MAKEIKKKDSWLDEFENLRPDFFFPEAWTDKQKEDAAEMVRPSRTKTAMFSSIPIRCQAEKCVFAKQCPLLAKGLAPKGKKCPIELSMVKQFTEDYMNDLNVDPDNLVEMSMVRSLVDQEIQMHRKTWLLSEEHFIQEDVVGMDKDGNVILKKELHKAVELEDKIHKRMKELRSQLLATREAKAKVGQGQLDTSQAISAAMAAVREYENVQREVLKKRLQVIDADVEEAELVEAPELESGD